MASKPPLMLQESFCMMLAESTMDLLYDRTPAFRDAVNELSREESAKLVSDLADLFRADYLLAVRPDPDAPDPQDKVTKIR